MSAKKNTLVRNASVLMVATIVSRIIGLLYRRPLGSIVGAVGMGYYAYASNLYSILVIIASYSIPMAVSKLVSEQLAKKQYRNAQKYFRGALVYGVAIGGAVALITFFFGRFLLPPNQQEALPALQMLAPTIFLSAILGVLRGYFQAHRTMLPTSISQIVEQIANAIVSVLAAWILVSGAAAGGDALQARRGALGGTMGTSAGVLVGLLFMLFVFMINRGYFRRERKRDATGVEEGYGEVIRTILLMATPIIFSALINNVHAYLNSYIYSGIQGAHGMASTAIAAAQGEFSNYYIPLVGIPLAIGAASASAMMPEVSGRFATGAIDEANAQIHQTLRLTMFICIPCMIGLTVLAYPIMGLLFPAASELAAKLLLTGSLYVIFAALSTITAGVLQSIGRQTRALVNAAIALGVNVVVLVLLLLIAPRLDIYSVMIVQILFSAICTLLNARDARKYLGFRAEWKKTYLEPLAASALMGAAAYGLYRLLRAVTRRPSIAVIIAIVVAVPVYLILYVLISRTTEEELRHYPMGGRLVAFLRFVRVLK